MSKDSNSESSSLPKIRTFAADLERTRQRSSKDSDSKKSDKESTSEQSTNSTTDKKPEQIIDASSEDQKTDHLESVTTPAKSTSKQKQKDEHRANPPFHTIAKQMKQSSTPSQSKPLKIDISEFERSQKEATPSVLESAGKQKEVVIDDEDDTVGTIVSDVKRKQFRFFPSLFASIRQSLIELGELFTNKNKRTYSIPDSDRRKGVIQTATSNTGRLATGDHADVITRLRDKRKSGEKTSHDTDKNKLSSANDAESNTSKVRITKKEAGDHGYTQAKSESEDETNKVITDPSHLLEDGHDDAAPSDTTPKTDDEKNAERRISMVAVEQRKSVTSQRAVVPDLTPVVPDEPTAPRTVPTVENDPLSATAAEVPEPVEPSAPSTTRSTFVQPPAVTPTSSGAFNNEMAIEAERAGTEIPVEQEEPLSPEEKEKQRHIAETNLLAVGTVVSILLVFTAFLAIRAIYDVVMAPQNVPIEYQPAVFIDDIIIRTITLQKPDRTALINSLLAAQASEVSATTQLNPTIIAGEIRADLPAMTTLTLLGAANDTSFVQSVDSVAFGVRPGSEIFIMMSVTDTSAARGGLLVWEEDMGQDLAPIMGISSTSLAIDDDLLSPFVDDTVGEIDVRVLGPTEDPELIYGFIDQATVLFAADRTEFATIADMLRQ